MTTSSTIVMSTAILSRIRVWDGVILTISNGTRQYYGPAADAVEGHPLLEFNDITRAVIDDERQTVSQLQGAVITPHHRERRLEQTPRTFRELKRLLTRECDHVDVEWLFPSANGNTTFSHATIWREPAYDCMDKRERCLHFHAVTMMMPSRAFPPD